MPIASLDLDRAIFAVWAGDLDWEFKKLWRENGDRDEFPSLHPQEAGPAQPMPYAILSIRDSTAVARMTNDAAAGRMEIHEVPVTFQIYTRELYGIEKSPKQIAGELADHVMMRYGGHPTVVPQDIQLEIGSWIQTQFQSMVGVNEGDDNHSITINYIMTLDLPRAA